MSRINQAVLAMRWSRIGVAYLFLIPCLMVFWIDSLKAACVGLASSSTALWLMSQEFMLHYRHSPPTSGDRE
jgi:hypothetical protein